MLQQKTIMRCISFFFEAHKMATFTAPAYFPQTGGFFLQMQVRLERFSVAVIAVRKERGECEKLKKRKRAL